MKKMIVLIVLLAASASMLHAALFEFRSESNGRWNQDPNGGPAYIGYVNVDVIDAWLVSIVSCSNPGNNSCPPNPIIKGADPEDQQAVEAAREHANNKITQGILSGMQPLPSGLTVKWQSTTQDHLNGFIKIWETGEPEPDENTYL